MNMDKQYFLEFGGRERDGRIYINAEIFNKAAGTNFSDKEYEFFFDCKTHCLMIIKDNEPTCVKNCLDVEKVLVQALNMSTRGPEFTTKALKKRYMKTTDAPTKEGMCEYVWEQAQKVNMWGTDDAPVYRIHEVLESIADSVYYELRGEK